jgi:MoaA/NifB/PqqE/SkfB family radical SAM enzyme
LAHSILWRIRNRGLVGTTRQTTFYLSRYARFTTPRKLGNFLIAKASKALRRERSGVMPYRYTIDPTNVCNLRCPLCPTGLGILKRERGMMELDHFRRFVDQIAPWSYLLELYNWGESFLHPQIFDIVSYAHERKMVVRLSSNLNRFNEEMASSTVSAGLDAIHISVDGATEESYQRYRRRGRLETVLRNLQFLVDARRRCRANNPLIVVRLLVNRYNEHEIAVVREQVLAIGADIFTTGYLFIDTTEPAQRAEWLPTHVQDSAYPTAAEGRDIENVWHCSDLWESMTINWDGGVSPCCWIHDQQNDFANALEQPIQEIWNGAAYVSARRVFHRGGPREGQQKVICAECRGRPRYLKM